MSQKLGIQKKTDEVKEEELKVPPVGRRLRRRKQTPIKDISSVSSKLGSDETYSLCGKKRKRKNSDQVKVLIEYFKKNPRWDKETVDKAAKKSGLSRAQVYKWGWDRKKKTTPDEEGFIKPSKDEFGGYSKHDFVEADDPIADLLDIDLNHEIQKLALGLDSSQTPEKKALTGAKPKDKSKTVSSRKRNVKAQQKEEEVKLSPIKEEYSEQRKSRTLVKDAMVQTPDVKKFTNEDFVTPIKTSRILSIEGNKGLLKVKQTLFSDSSEKDKGSGSKSE